MTNSVFLCTLYLYSQASFILQLGACTMSKTAASVFILAVMVIVFWWSPSHNEATYFTVGTYVLEEILLDSLLSHIVMTLHRYEVHVYR